MSTETERSKVFDLEEPIDRDHEKLLYERLLFVSIIEIHQRLQALERGYVKTPILMNDSDLRAGLKYLERDIVNYYNKAKVQERAMQAREASIPSLVLPLTDNSRCAIQGRHCGNPTCTKFHGVPDGSNNSQGT